MEKNHSDTALYYNNLAYTYEKLCKLGKAVECAEKSYRIMLRIYGGEDVKTMEYLENFLFLEKKKERNKNLNDIFDK